MRIRLFLSTLVCLFVFGLNMKAQTSIASGTQITMSMMQRRILKI